MARPVEQVIEEMHSWQNVPHELAKRGIQGKKNSCYSCPIANYIYSSTSRDEVKAVLVGLTRTMTVDPAGKWTYFDSPIRIQNFIRDFDAGAYPDLDIDPEGPGEYDEYDEYDEEDEQEDEDDDPWG